MGLSKAELEVREILSRDFLMQPERDEIRGLSRSMVKTAFKAIEIDANVDEGTLENTLIKIKGLLQREISNDFSIVQSVRRHILPQSLQKFFSFKTGQRRDPGLYYQITDRDVFTGNPVIWQFDIDDSFGITMTEQFSEFKHEVVEFQIPRENGEYCSDKITMILTLPNSNPKRFNTFLNPYDSQWGLSFPVNFSIVGNYKMIDFNKDLMRDVRRNSGEVLRRLAGFMTSTKGRST